MSKIKLYFVRKWLHLLPYSELKQYVKEEGLRLEVDKTYSKLAKSMVDLYYKEFMS